MLRKRVLHKQDRRLRKPSCDFRDSFLEGSLSSQSDAELSDHAEKQLLFLARDVQETDISKLTGAYNGTFRSSAASDYGGEQPRLHVLHGPTVLAPVACIS